jgi:hypothetical protein
VILRILRLLAALLVVNALLLGPRWLVPGTEPVPWVALEAALIVGFFALLPDRAWTRRASLAGGAVVVLLAILAFADAAARMVLARPVNLYLDFPLLRAIGNLLIGMIGFLPAVAVFLGAGLVLCGVMWLTAWLLSPGGTLGRTGGAGRTFKVMERERGIVGPNGPRWVPRLVGTVLMLPMFVWWVVPRLPFETELGTYGVAPVWTGTPSVELIVAQAIRLRETFTERERFEADLAAAPVSYEDVDGLFGRLQGRDVVLAFIESYGVTVIDDPRYQPLILPRLQDLQRRVEAAGLYIVSGTLVAPTQGGESWFSHGSFLSGLWLGNQIRYDLMIGSGRETLIDDFERAGYRTVAIMPAITYAWPEGERLRYDEIFTRADIPYAGPPLNWVTMPDQFTWSFLENGVRGANRSPTGAPPGEADPTDRPPLFAEIALISSHAPWTPILPVLDDWDSIGDGSVFQQWANAGEKPEVLWLDTERVREHYALSIDYALNAMAGYVERYVDENMLLIALGDHQPAPLVTGDGASWEVPVHVISGDPDLLTPFLEWGFLRGAMPSRAYPDRGMDYFRHWFVHAYSLPGSEAAPTPTMTAE